MTPDRERLGLVVHEVRSPVAALAAVRGALSDRPVEPSAARRLLEIADAACLAIERLVRELAVTSVVLEPVDAIALADEVAASVSLTSAHSVVARHDEAQVIVDADPIRLRQAVDNLVRNAVAVSPPEREVAIDIVARVDAVRISVSDAGPGIAERDLSRIFEPGVRLDETRPGSGLGLAVTRAIADAHGWALGVESTLGVGSTFTLELPRLR